MVSQTKVWCIKEIEIRWEGVDKCKTGFVLNGTQVGSQIAVSPEKVETKVFSGNYLIHIQLNLKWDANIKH